MTAGTDGGREGTVWRVAQIGCGQISAEHLKAYRESDLVELALVVDVNPEAAQEASRANGDVPWTTDFEEAIGRSDVTLVSLATPHHLHAPQTIAAARAGKHVLCEKPLTTTLEAADEMLGACREHGRQLGVWFVARYSPIYQTARALLQAGTIGELVNIRLPDVHNKVQDYYQRGVGGRARPSTWRGSRSTSGGGALIMNAIHQIDVLRFITGLEVQRISAEWVNFTGLAEVEDMIAVVMRYNNGAIGSIESANYAPGGGEPSILRLYGSKGQLQLSRQGLRVYVDQAVPARDGLPALEAGTWQEVPLAARGNPRRLLLEDFVRAAQAGRTPPVSGVDGRAALEIVLGAYLSAESGCSVTLPVPTAAAAPGASESRAAAASPALTAPGAGLTAGAG
ncbi:MAG TPA: Gfo/Idh/MocA family oxidoreductase [Chloroflexota bacterium]|nr:Gfo/Idh/MocA family oxidoreductase [Chloroflexota bacterium]